MSQGYLIDPDERTVTLVTISQDDDVRDHVLADTLDGHQVGMIQTTDGRLTLMVIYVDEEGWYAQGQTWFTFAGSEPLAGRGLLVGADAAGENIDPPLPLDVAREMISWLGRDLPAGSPAAMFAGPVG